MANINFHNVSDEERALVLASNDTISFGKLFLQDDFMRSATPPLHYAIADASDNKSIKRLAIIIPRGHGKTVLTKAGILKDFLFEEDDLFYGWLSATKKLSVGNMDYIKYHLEFNPKISYYFGSIKGTKWTEDDIEVRPFVNPFGVQCGFKKLLSKSNVAGIRGGAKLHKRYDLAILDDFEDENNTISPEARAKNKNLVTAVVQPALEPHTGRIRINGTPVHYDSFINNLLVNHAYANETGKDFSWKVITAKAILPDGSALWPSFFPLSLLDRKKREARDDGNPAKFYQEYMMEVQSEEDSLFNRHQIQYHNAHYHHDGGINYLTIDGETFPVLTFLGCDPATDINTKESDFSVIMVVAVDGRNNLYVLEYVRDRAMPTIGMHDGDKVIGKAGVVDTIFNMYDKYHCTLGTVEDVAMNRSIFQSLDSERIRRNKFNVKIVPEKPGGRDKRNRIYSILSSRFALRTIYLSEAHYALVDEIVTFGPRMAHDDTIDALAYAVMNAYPPRYQKNEQNNIYHKYRPTPKGWRVA